MTLIALGICIGMALPVIFWYNRNESWSSIRNRSILTLPLMILGIIIFHVPEISANETLGNELRVFAIGLIYPQVISIIELVLSQLSIQVNGRDFYTWLQRSQDAENKEIQFRWLDRFISMFLVFGTTLFFLGLIHWLK